MADENRVIKEISCKLFHTAKAWNDLLAQLLVDMAKYIPPKQLQAEGFVSLSSQKRFAMAKHIPSDLVHMAKDYATFLSQSLFGMANYISRELLRMGKGCASLLSAKLFLMAGKRSDKSKERWQFYGTGIGKASALLILALLLLDLGKGPKGTKPPPCPAGFSPSKEIHTVTRNNKPTEPKNYPELSLKKIVIAPEIKKPTEPKYEQTSSSSSMNASPKSLLPVYAVPDDLKDLIEKDKVPQVLRNPLTASTYSAYSAVVAPEIKKPTEPKYEQTSSSSSTNAARKSLLPVYAVPDCLKDLIKKDKVPQVLRDPLTASTYSAYFAALLNAEDYYIEKWNGFLMFNVTLQLHEELSHAMKIKNSFSKKNKDGTKIGSGDKKVYVVFEIGSVPENRPFLLSRDFVYIKPAGMEVEPFKGYLSRVVKNNHVWTEFGDDFFSQYSPHCKYDVRFSFNRVPLKRAHDAVAAASDPSFQTFLFPDPTSRTGFSIPISVIPSNRNLGQDQVSAISQILNLKEPPPYLVEGPLSIIYSNQISRTGVVIREAILQIYKASRNYKVLIAAPKNHTCDVLMESLQLEIPRSETFRANAAFRDPSEVPEGIFSSSLYEGECFTCPPLAELRNYRVITSTYISSFRLRSSGINAGHFSHIFLVDASSASEPDTMVALTNLANEKTAVVVTGTLNDHPGRLRSDIARKKGLAVSYFERLLNRKPYSDQDPRFVKRICIENSESY